METYRLKSKLIENDREFVIQTLNDTNLGAISSEVYVDGRLAETTCHPHPVEIRAEEVLSLLKATHGEKKKELELLLAAYRRILKEGNPEMLLHLGTALYYKGFFNEAREVLSGLTEMKPEHHQARNQLALTHLALDEVDDAVSNAAAAVDTCPNYADYRNNYGEALLAAGRFEPAHVQFKEALDINIYYGNAYFNLGLTYLALAETNELINASKELIAKAADCFKRASMINSGYDAGYFEDGMRALREGELGRAWTSMSAVRADWQERRRRDFAGFHMRFILHPEWVSERTVDERIRYLEREIRKNPGYVDLHTELGRCYLEKARLCWQSGVEQYRKATELNPSLARAAERLDRAEKQYDEISATLEDMGQKG
jgi:tetratricopeptide (TPR) repeat protein